MTRLTLLALLAACATAPPPPPPARDVEPPLALEEGSCFGLAEAEPAAPVALLGGRLVLTPPAVALRLDDRPSPRLPAGRDSETLLWVSPPEASLLLWSAETFRRAEEGELERAVRSVHERDPRFRVRALALEAIEAVAAIPRDPIAREGQRLLVEVYTRTPDGWVQRTRVFADPQTAQAAGCQRQALRLASALRPGRRALPTARGRVALRPGLTVELPSEHAVEVIAGPGHSVYRLWGAHPLTAEPAPELRIHVGASAPFAPPSGARHFEAELLARPARWYQARVLDIHERAGRTTAPGLGPVQVTLRGPDRESLGALQEIVDTLATDAAPDPAPSCAATDAIVPEPAADLAQDPVVRTLLASERFATDALAFEASPSALIAAFRELAARPDAGRAFEHLVASDGTAARLWGLAGLSATGDRRFRGLFCHVAPTLEGPVEVHRLCGPQTVEVGTLLARDEAPRSPGFWEAREFASVPRDIRGGGIGHELRWGPIASPAVATAVRALAGGASEPAAFAGARRADPMVLEDDRLCAARRDGRWACFGATSERLYPPSVTRPAAVAGHTMTCFVDAEGRRTCAGPALDRALATRAAACGGEPPAPLSTAKAFADGPWQLIDLGEPCGLDPAGTLHCFRGAADPPEWARGADALAFGEPYPVLPGVVGASRGHGSARWAWTEAGRVFRWDDREPPRAVAELEGLRRIVGGMRVTFAELEDGRVLALGPQPGEPWWDVVGQLGREWVELPALRGGALTVGAYHGCARFERGVVRCWGAASEGQLGGGGDGRRAPLTEVRELRGARSLLLATEVTCGRMGGGRLRCVGAGAGFLGEARGGRRELRPQRRLDRIERTQLGEGAPDAERPPSE